MEATEEFDIRYCTRTGGYGRVYIAMLLTGKVVVVKKLHRLEAEERAYENSFNNEITCNFSVYEYIERGSLAYYVLGNKEEAVELDWRKHIKVIKGVAHALPYLHHDCSPPLIHLDILSNNVLLDANLEPHVADFGTSRFLNPGSSNRTILAGTYGYIAPVIACRDRLSSIQILLQTDHLNPSLAEEEKIEADTLSSLLAQEEESFFRQKSKINWLELGDSNTAYFHRSVKARSNLNSITKLISNEGNLVHRVDEIKKVAVDHFENLFRPSISHGPPIPNGLLNKSIPASMASVLMAIPSDEEISATIHSHKASKAPGPDGFSIGFFSSSWGISLKMI
ncbi:cold-responsive protein kinase 1-like [Macadamia integrifolia]|uniref:cold-responsive protein kinase 1-like n=1 Tax=Macadamia integrifolia TaxID=60698 RepID=UPI001C4EF65A|nr:cold-responsive protein kinase 1-like [Macadamia integrifolia]